MTAQQDFANGPAIPADTVLIEPRDPVVLRDARPFAAEPGARAFCLPWPIPQTVAGAIRTHLGNRANLDWEDKANAQWARTVVSRGPLMVGRDTSDGDWHAYVPAPRDVVFYRPETGSKALEAMVLRPVATEGDAGCDLPSVDDTEPGERGGYLKALANTDLCPLAVTADVKPEPDVPAWWRLDDAVRWLNTTATEPHGTLFPYVDPPPDRPDGKRMLRGVKPLKLDTRVHVSIEPEKQTNVGGALFTTESLAFRDAPDPETGAPAIGMLCQVEGGNGWDREQAVVPLGGERRVSHLSVNPTCANWPDVQVPDAGEFALADGLRLLLVTPAIFTHGWLPGWLADGTIPGLKGHRMGLKLVGVAIDRRIPVSGWRMAKHARTDGQAPRAEPRKTRYAVPAGGVYFFRFTNEKPTDEAWKEVWKKLWLAPVSDLGKDRDDGFGLVLPGLWRDEP